MAGIGILQVHETIALSGGEYCAVCYRTASERRLVEPVELRRFLGNTKNCIPFRKQFKACYICEALARSAQRFFKSVQLACLVADLYEDVTSTGQLERVIKCVTEFREHGDKVRGARGRGAAGGAERRALEAERALRAAVPLARLQRTDTLVVEAAARRRPTPGSDDVVIIDEDPPPPPPGPPAAAPGAEGTHVSVIDPRTDEVTLHPIIHGVDGNKYVPTLQVQLLDNGLFKSLPQVLVHNPIPPHTATQPAPTNTSILQNHLTNTNKSNENKTLNKHSYYNFIQSQTKEKNSDVSTVEIIKTNSVNIILNSGDRKKRKIEKDPLSLDSESVDELSEDTKNGEVSLVEDDADPGASGVANRRPLLRTDRTVDWEDKIPMDVISFMDATDPHPAERIMQPARPRGMGFISDVRSLPAHPHPAPAAPRPPGVAAPRPPGVAAPRPPGVAGLRPPGVAAPRPPGVAAPRPPGVAAPRPPAGGATPRARRTRQHQERQIECVDLC